MTDATNRRSLPQLRSGPLIVGGILAGAGVMLVLAGVTVGGAHLLAATRQWVGEMEVPPSELARQQWARAKAAAPGRTDPKPACQLANDGRPPVPGLDGAVPDQPLHAERGRAHQNEQAHVQ